MWWQIPLMILAVIGFFTVIGFVSIYATTGKFPGKAAS